MHKGKFIGAVLLAGAAFAGPVATAAAAEAPQPESGVTFDEHEFNGSSTQAEAFRAWFAGGKYVEPKYQTRDLTELKVNEYETAHAGDVIVKDDQGRFWIEKDAVVK